MRAQRVLLATGGGPTMYKYHTPSGDKSCDGMAMALRAGLAAARHGDGAVPSDRAARRRRHAHDRHGARGGPARLGRLSARRRAASASCSTTTRAASARRATSSAARIVRPRCARATPRPNGGVYIAMGHLGPDNVRARVQGHGRALRRLRLRSRRRPVEVVPTAHYMMGGVVFDADCTTRAAAALRRRRGHRRRARRQPARRQRRRQLHRVRRHRRRRRWPAWLRGERRAGASPTARRSKRRSACARAPLRGTAGDLEAVREKLYDAMWDDVGIVRDAASLRRADAAPRRARSRARRIGVPGGRTSRST